MSTAQVRGVNAPFATASRDPDGAMLPDGPPTGGHVPVEGPMADLAYALLIIGGFALLVLMVRGLDSL